MKNDQEIVDQVKKIRNRYKMELVDTDEVEMSFIDEVNDLIKNIFGDSSNDVYTALTPGKLDKWNKSRKRKILAFIRKTMRKILTIRTAYFLLLCTITGFLVSEAVSFYAVDGLVDTKTWVKAILTEVCFIFLSGYRAEGKWNIAAVSSLRLSIFVLMMFVITSGVAFQGAEDVAEINNISSQIERVEEDIKMKEKTIDFYRKKDWGVNVRIQETARDRLRDTLLTLKQIQLDSGKSEGVSDLIIYKSYGKAAFRLILLLISALLSRRMFKF